MVVILALEIVANWFYIAKMILISLNIADCF